MALEADRDQITGDRLKILALDKQITQLHREYMTKQESQSFDAMRLDLELEEKMRALAECEILTLKVTKEYTLRMVKT